MYLNIHVSSLSQRCNCFVKIMKVWMDLEILCTFSLFMLSFPTKLSLCTFNIIYVISHNVFSCYHCLIKIIPFSWKNISFFSTCLLYAFNFTYLKRYYQVLQNLQKKNPTKRHS